MLFAGARILTGIMMVGAVAASLPEAAYAQSCNNGSLAAGDVKSFSYTLDADRAAQFTLDNVANDMSLLVVDDQSNVVCETSISDAGAQSCSWQPMAGAVYTAQVRANRELRAANAALASAHQARVEAQRAANSEHPR